MKVSLRYSCSFLILFYFEWSVQIIYLHMKKGREFEDLMPSFPSGMEII